MIVKNDPADPNKVQPDFSRFTDKSPVQCYIIIFRGVLLNATEGSFPTELADGLEQHF